jgi:hypothetical protein
MKPIFLFLILFFTAELNAQITLTRADFPKPTANSTLPDSVLYTNVTTGTPTSHTLNGINQIWSETLLSGNPTYQQYLPMSSTPFVFQLLFLSSDYAQPLLNGGNVAGNTLSDAFEYYDYASSDSRLQVRGFGGNILIPGQTTSIPLPALYSSPDIMYRFPMQYGNIDSSNSGFNVTLPLGGIVGDITLKRNQKRVNEVDGWGRITIPSGGTYDVLRQVSKIKRIDSFITGFFPVGFPSQPIEFKWLAQGMKYPVLQINGNQTGNGITITSSTFLGGWPLQNSQIELNQQSFIYPNPTANNCMLEYSLSESSNVDIYVYSSGGIRCGEFHFLHQQTGTHQDILPIDNLSAGTYFIQCKTNNNSFVQKLIKL